MKLLLCHRSMRLGLQDYRSIVFQSTQLSDGEWLVLAAEDLVRIKLRQELARIYCLHFVVDPATEMSEGLTTRKTQRVRQSRYGPIISG
jgi:hypothetical protein